MTGPVYSSSGIKPPRRRRSAIGMDTLDPDVLRGLLQAVTDQPTSVDALSGTRLLSPPPSIRHLTETDVARRWRMSVRTLQAWRGRKVGPPYLKAMGKVLYRLSDIETFEAEHLHGSVR